jgi:predicted DNA-binding protein
MYVTYIVKRTQIYLDEEQSQRLAQRAAAGGVTSSKLIREAIEQYLTTTEDESLELDRQRTALLESFGAIPRLPDGAAFVEQVRQADLSRDRELQDRWRGR